MLTNGFINDIMAVGVLKKKFTTCPAPNIATEPNLGRSNKDDRLLRGLALLSTVKSIDGKKVDRVDDFMDVASVDISSEPSGPSSRETGCITPRAYSSPPRTVSDMFSSILSIDGKKTYFYDNVDFSPVTSVISEVLSPSPFILDHIFFVISP